MICKEEKMETKKIKKWGSIQNKEYYEKHKLEIKRKRRKKRIGQKPDKEAK